jgi:hypothetical protein
MRLSLTESDLCHIVCNRHMTADELCSVRMSLASQDSGARATLVLLLCSVVHLHSAGDSQLHSAKVALRRHCQWHGSPGTSH